VKPKNISDTRAKRIPGENGARERTRFWFSAADLADCTTAADTRTRTLLLHCSTTHVTAAAADDVINYYHRRLAIESSGSGGNASARIICACYSVTYVYTTTIWYWWINALCVTTIIISYAYIPTAGRRVTRPFPAVSTTLESRWRQHFTRALCAM